MRLDELGAAQREIVTQYARLGRVWRNPTSCKPTEAERRGPKRRRDTDYEVIFDNRESARACVNALVDLGTGVESGMVYPCQHSRKGHYHVTLRFERPKRCLVGA